MAAPGWFVEKLQALQVVQGKTRSTYELAEWASLIDRRAAPSQPTIARWLSGTTVPLTFPPLQVLVTAVLERAHPRMSQERLQIERQRWERWWSHAREASRDNGEPANPLTGALSQRADEAWEQICQAELAEDAMRVLLALVHLSDDAEYDTRRRVSRGALLGDPPAPEAVQALAILTGPPAGLLTCTVTRSGGGDFEPVDPHDPRREITLADEALIGEWPPLAAALIEQRADLIARQDLERDARRWQAANRDPDRLPRGSALAEAHRVLYQYCSYGGLTGEFLDHATQAQDQARCRHRWTTIGLALALVALVVVAVTVWWAWSWVTTCP